MKILLVTSNFNSLTGSEMYFYELSRELVNYGHDVSILSSIGGIISEKALNNNVKLFDFKNPPKENFDIINFSHTHIFNNILNNDFLNKTQIIQTCHSEIIPVEFPIKHVNIKKYIGIRDSIVSLVRNNIVGADVDLIMNPIDFNRFNENLVKSDYSNLFVGSIDNLRINALLDNYNECQRVNKKLIIVGRNDYPNKINNGILKNVEIYPPCWDLTEHLSKCDTVVGILLGRSSLEGLCSGKKSIQYQIDSGGNILSKKITTKHDYNLDDFNSKIVANKIIKIYESIL